MAARILVVDDEAHITRAVRMKLSKAGFDVETACDGREAWEIIQRDPPELVVTDLQMPHMDGLELCRRVRQNETTSDMPLILVTARGLEYDEDAVSRALRPSHIFWKPFSPRELLKCVQESLQLETAAGG